MFFIKNDLLMSELNHVKKSKFILSNTKNVYSFYKKLLIKFVNSKINNSILNYTITFLKNYFYFLEFEKQVSRLHHRVLIKNNFINFHNTNNTPSLLLRGFNFPITITILFKYYARSSYINNNRLLKHINKVFNNKSSISNNRYYLYKYQSSYSKKNNINRRKRISLADKKRFLKNFYNKSRNKSVSSLDTIKLFNKYQNVTNFYLKYIRYNTSFLKNINWFSINSLRLQDINYNTLLCNDFVNSRIFISSNKKLFFIKKKKYSPTNSHFNYRKYIGFFNFIFYKAKKNFNSKIKFSNSITLYNDASFYNTYLYNDDDISFISYNKNYLTNNAFYYNNFVNRYFYQNKNIFSFFLSKKKVGFKSHFLSNLFKFFFSVNKNRFLLKKNLYFYLNLNTLGIVYFKNTLRNIFITISTHNGKHLYHISSGYVKSLGRKKTSNRTIYNLTRKFILKLHLILRTHNITHIRMVIQGHFNNIFVFIKPFLKKFYARNKINSIFKNYIYFFKKYIIYLKRLIIKSGNYTLFNLNKYILIVLYCHSINRYLQFKTNKFFKSNIKLLNVQMISSKFFGSR